MGQAAVVFTQIQDVKVLVVVGMARTEFAIAVETEAVTQLGTDQIAVCIRILFVVQREVHTPSLMAVAVVLAEHPP